jgi:succinylarginine dihydrolase
MFVEVNFDGLIGPTHNYAGLSLGNVASATNRGAVSSPRAAALQGIAKMRAMIGLGVPQGLLLPHERPAVGWLRALGFAGDDDAVCAAAWRADPGLLRNALAASAMWTANAATVSPAPDTADSRCHLSIANLATMAHRSIEATETERQLRLAFADQRHFQVHAPVPSAFGDEGAANVMRVAAAHGQPGVEILVYGARQPDGFPARQDRRAFEAIARRHGLSPERTVFARQSDAAIQAGAFHNDVVAVANEGVLLAHEHAFADPAALYDALRARLPGIRIVEVPAAAVSLADAVGSYLFNSQLVTLPGGGITLIAPVEARENAAVAAWLADRRADSPIGEVRFLDVRESMRNGGGPACLRLRVAVDAAALAAIDPRFLVDEAKCDALSALVERHWPKRIGPDDLGSAGLWQECRAARQALLRLIDPDAASA